jgi:hypothetical protein
MALLSSCASVLAEIPASMQPWTHVTSASKLSLRITGTGSSGPVTRFRRSKSSLYRFGRSSANRR